MALTVRDLFDIDVFKNFKLIAGEGGLGRPVKDTEILDFEFVQGAGMDREKIFDGESIMLTSLLFAKDNPALITDAVRRLYELNVSCMAYKPVLIKKLPEEALRFADEHDFPILEFGGDEFFESIIFAVRKENGAGRDIAEMELSLENMLERDISAKEVARFVKRLNPEFRRYVRIVGVMDVSLSYDRIISLLNTFSKNEKIGKKTALMKFREGFFIVLSQDTEETSRFDALFSDVLSVLGYDTENAHLGFSTIRRTEGGFDKVFREAFWSSVAAAMENRRRKDYSDMGIFRFVTSHINSDSMRESMEEFLRPVTEDSGDLLDTARTYILCGGDLEKTAEKLFCHKNTIRYRLAKIQELTDPHSTEKEFYANLSLAVKIHLLMQYKER